MEGATAALVATAIGVGGGEWRCCWKRDDEQRLGGEGGEERGEGRCHNKTEGGMSD